MFESNPNIKAGTFGGTFLSILPQLNSQDILVTVILAMVGAITSFLVSLVLKYLVELSKKSKSP
jgi:hypothetical protein